MVNGSKVPLCKSRLEASPHEINGLGVLSLYPYQPKYRAFSAQTGANLERHSVDRTQPLVSSVVALVVKAVPPEARSGTTRQPYSGSFQIACLH